MSIPSKFPDLVEVAKTFQECQGTDRIYFAPAGYNDRFNVGLSTKTNKKIIVINDETEKEFVTIPMEEALETAARIIVAYKITKDMEPEDFLNGN